MAVVSKMLTGYDEYNAAKTPLIDLLQRIHPDAVVQVTEPSGWSYHAIGVGKTMREAAEKLQELEAELKVSDKLLEDRDALLAAIPECPAHGRCVPHAIEWIERVKTLAKIVTGA